MRIYPKASYSESLVVNVIGPIECWWDTEEEPQKFDSPEARRYRAWRGYVCDALAEYFLVYRPHEAFKGKWNEKAQAVNDVAITTSDFVVNLKPEGVVALGTDYEENLAREYGLPVFAAPPPESKSHEVMIEVAREFARTLDLTVKGMLQSI